MKAPIEHGATFEQLLAMDAQLVAGGMLPFTDWWKSVLPRWYRHPTARTLVARVGRGGVKSQTATKVAVAEVLFGQWRVPPGEVHFFGFISLSKDEAAQRLHLIRSMLQILGVPFDAAGDTITLKDQPLGWRVFASQVGSVSGFRCIGYIADECAKWENADHSANPAHEITASMDAQCITHAAARRMLVSSPWAMDDLHFELMQKGDTDDQVTCYAPTWIANPSITFEQCVAASHGDQRVLNREYKAEAGGTISQALDPADALAAFDLRPPREHGQGFCAIDASSLRGDKFAYVCGFETSDGIVIGEVAAASDDDLRGHDMAEVVEAIAARAQAWGTVLVFGDQRESASLQSLFEQNGCRLETFAWSESSKEVAFSTLRRMLRERRIVIAVQHDELRREMLGCKARLSPSGHTTYATNGLDFLSCLVTWAHARGNAISAGAMDEDEFTLLDLESNFWGSAKR